MQMSQHEANMILVKMLNYEYVLKVNKVTGEIDERQQQNKVKDNRYTQKRAS